MLLSYIKNKTVTGVFDMWGLRQWGAWRVMVLLQPTAAFFWMNLGHQLCCVAHDGSDAAVWLTASHRRGKEGPLQCDWLLCKQQHRMLIVAFLNRLGSDLCNKPWTVVQLKDRSRWMKHVCLHVHQEHIHSHTRPFHFLWNWQAMNQVFKNLQIAVFFF